MDELDFRRFLVKRYPASRLVSGPFGRLIQMGTLSPLDQRTPHDIQMGLT
jgi:hypothetical protein